MIIIGVKSRLYVNFSELRLPPKATTTPTPHVHTTPKPRRKQHNNKAGHETGKAKSEPGLINVVQENELMSGISSEGKYNVYKCHLYYKIKL